ncbi:hypothetical protein LPJ61_003396 [Coemansia biformis]|uniref:RmlD-like substrate binding domain-containing protein n=1 Tax=Coemansia biformis TaxID=1286918 RepID=A0A9W8CY99_9FUNG|nr:hypothetical protein LPJ61_003396 [Coemansia biformis]
MSAERIKVVVTGASGLLGRAVAEEAARRGHTVIGTALTRATGGLVRVDLSDTAATESFLEEQQPQAIIHCAAEKRPDVAEGNQAAVEQLNAQTPGMLAAAAKRLGAYMVYVSTDYVFDGTKPPYHVGDRTNPLNFYGKTKLAGEQAVLAANEDAAVLRIPVLYGKGAPAESAVNALVELVNATEPTTVDARQLRSPTCTDDVARVLVDMAQQRPAGGIYHFSAPEQMTKYDMCRTFADILGVGATSMLVPATAKPQSPVADRPDNPQLATDALERAGISVSCVPFRQWWSAHLRQP